MLRNPLNFFAELIRQPAWIPIWVGMLMVINIASVAFWSEPLARWILVVFMASAMLMMGLYARFGFSKILGLGHVLWLPLLPVVVLAIPVAADGFRRFLIVWATATAISLAFDIADVWKHFSGAAREGIVTERAPGGGVPPDRSAP